MSYLRFERHKSGNKLKEPPRIHSPGDSQTWLRGTPAYNTGNYVIQDYPKYYSGDNMPPPGEWSYGPGSKPRQTKLTKELGYRPGKPWYDSYVYNDENIPKPNYNGKVERVKVENFNPTAGFVTDPLQPNRDPYYYHIYNAVAPTKYSKVNSNTVGIGNSNSPMNGIGSMSKTNNRFMYTPVPEYIYQGEFNTNLDPVGRLGKLQASYPSSVGLSDSGSRYGLSNYDQIYTYKYIQSPNAPGYGIDNINDRYENIGEPYSARNMQWNNKNKDTVLKYYYDNYEPTDTDSHSVQFGKFKHHLKYATPEENAAAINFYRKGIRDNNRIVPYGHIEHQGRLVDCTQLPELSQNTLCMDNVFSDTAYAKCQAQAQYLGRVPHRKGGYCKLNLDDEDFGIGTPFLNNKKLIKDIADADRNSLLLNEVPHKLQADPEYGASPRILSGGWTHSGSLKVPGMEDYWQNYSFNPVNNIKWNETGVNNLKRKY